jgi:O-methyltransferase
MNFLIDWFINNGITRSNLRWLRIRNYAENWFLKPYITQVQRKKLITTGDPVRYGSLFLSIEGLLKANIEGSLAECGVYRGETSKFIHDMLPDRKFFLFDTFSGFDTRDSDTINDNRFADTSERTVLDYIGDVNNIIIRNGYFPDSTNGLEKEKFALVMIDFDKYEPTLAALKYFYPLMSKNGFIFVHDYSSHESNWACSRALNEFLADKPEKPILIPDSWGTAVFRKV